MDRLRKDLRAAQVAQYALPPQPGKDTDSRAAGVVARHGRLVQVELDALPPNILGALYADAIAEFWDNETYQDSLTQEAADRAELERWVNLRGESEGAWPPHSS